MKKTCTCKHPLPSWSGKVPCTGMYRCSRCALPMAATFDGHPRPLWSPPATGSRPPDEDRYSVIGLYEDNGQIFNHHVKAPNPEAAVEAAGLGQGALVVEILAGHHPGLLGGDTALVADDPMRPWEG